MRLFCRKHSSLRTTVGTESGDRESSPTPTPTPTEGIQGEVVILDEVSSPPKKQKRGEKGEGRGGGGEGGGGGGGEEEWQLVPLTLSEWHSGDATDAVTDASLEACDTPTFIGLIKQVGGTGVDSCINSRSPLSPPCEEVPDWLIG